MDNQKIQRMDSNERLEQFGLNCIISELDIGSDDQIMDVGACTGAFSLPIANQLADGHVYAVDVDEEPLEILKRKILKDSIDNITPIHIDNEKLSVKHGIFDDGMDILGIEDNSMDKIFMCTVLHEVEDKEHFLKTYMRFLKPGGKIYIAEFASAKRKTYKNTNSNPHFISQDEVTKLLHDANYKNISVKKINELIYMMSAQKE